MKHCLLTILTVMMIVVLGTVNADAITKRGQAKSEYLLADELYNKNDYKGAIEHALKEKETLGQTNSQIEYLLVKAYVELNNYFKAFAAIEKFLEVTPESQSSTPEYNEMVALYPKVGKEKKDIEKKFGQYLNNIEMVAVSGECFQMGDSFDDGNKNEQPVHEVCVDAFQIGKYEVTQGLWQAVMGTNPSKYNSDSDFPVESVSWNYVQEFIMELRKKTGNSFRLPTETEWEYACRSGGKNEKYCGSGNVDSLAWYKQNSDYKTHKVGTKSPNGLGIYDMSGNVWEWCSDLYRKNYNSPSPGNNPEGTSSNSFRVPRGGSWYGEAKRVRSTNRRKRSTEYRNVNLGFRLVLPPGQ